MKKDMQKISSRKAAMTRARILAAARVRFSNESYEVVGMRDVAADAGVDAALVSRYFGGKEKLFAAVLHGGFRIEEHLSPHLHGLGVYLAQQVMDKGNGDQEKDQEFDALRVLLRSAGTPSIAAMVSECIHEEFVKPLAKLLSGQDTELRAALIAAYVIGLATMRHALNSPGLSATSLNRAIEIAGAAIQDCVG